MSWDDRDVYEVLDDWWSVKASCYTEESAAAVASELELFRAHCRSADEEHVLDSIIEQCDVGDVRSDARSWYSGQNSTVLMLSDLFNGPRVRELFGENDHLLYAQPFIEATSDLRFFVNACGVAREKLGGLEDGEIDKICKFTYGGLDGFIRSEAVMRDAKIRALYRLNETEDYEIAGIERSMRDRSLIVTGHTLIYRQLLCELDSVRYVRTPAGDIVLPRQGEKPLVLVRS